MAVKFNAKTAKKAFSILISALGAIGVALQNTIAVALFLRSVISGFTTITNLLSKIIHGVAIGFGGMSSGMVNFFMNVELLDDFIARMSTKQSNLNLKGWRKFRYYAGTFVFVVTGILFGATAFTFGMSTPFAAIAVAAGVLVSIIMTIQEVETWLSSFKPEAPEDVGLEDKTSLYNLFIHWKSTLTFNKAIGHFIAAGNVIALSLLFTLGLAEVLISLEVAAFTAFVLALSISFTFGAFTEFYFYNFFLADFCNNIGKEWQKLKQSPHATLALICVSINAFVNGALTYSGVGLLSGLLLTAGIALPPVAVLVGLASVSAIFAGAASFLLGMKFMIPKTLEQNPRPMVAANQDIPPNGWVKNTTGTSGLGFFKAYPLVESKAVESSKGVAQSLEESKAAEFSEGVVQSM